MEIVNIKKGTNYEYLNNLCKGRKVLSGFNKLEESLLNEYMLGKDYECQNVFFEKEIEADLYITYPLSVLVKETVSFSSLYELIKNIRQVYKKIYKEERKSFKDSEKGKYGIWGHELSDLYLEYIKILEDNNRPIIIIHVDS